jgi:hypothetical protein
MPGPPPKPASQRRRRNKAPKPIKLAKGAEEAGPRLPNPDVLPETVEWWETVWASPMAAVWLEADVPALARLAGLVERLHRGDSSSRLLSEIRALEDRFGLSPLARRRLQWEIEQAHSEAKPAGEGQERRWLRAVSD